jgi:hypothetical protein
MFVIRREKELIAMAIKPNKLSKINTKRPSKGKRIHTRRLKEAARKASGTPQI